MKILKQTTIYDFMTVAMKLNSKMIQFVDFIIAFLFSFIIHNYQQPLIKTNNIKRNSFKQTRIKIKRYKNNLYMVV